MGPLRRVSRRCWSGLEYVDTFYRVFARNMRDLGTPVYPRTLYWHYWLASGQTMPRLNPDNPKFRLAVAGSQRLPLALANRLGPHIVRNLP